MTREAEIRATCKGLDSLACICIEEGIEPKAAQRLHALFFGLLDALAVRAAQVGVALAVAGRTVPGSVSGEPASDERQTTH